ncbi:MAG: DUF58 domain-containing protein [bacterium]|nr:DUF58 domain-containing protein [bacterium]
MKRAAPPDTQAIPRQHRLTSVSQAPIDRLRLTVLRRLDGLLAGDHAGLFPGHGTEYGEARPYEPGDDPRHIDWAVTARTNEPHVRDTIADHELELWLVLDSSSSLAFGTGIATKHEIAWSAAGAMALLASDRGNRVGSITTTPHGDKARPRLLPARAGANHVGAVLASLHHPPEDGVSGDLPAAIDMVRRTARRRGMAVVVSDFLGSTSWERPMRALSHRHELVAIEVVDERELRLPDVGLISVRDPETGRARVVDTAQTRTRERYAELAAAHRADVRQALARCGADHLVLSTDRDWVLDFVQFVATRRSRLLAAGRRAR